MQIIIYHKHGEYFLKSVEGQKNQIAKKKKTLVFLILDKVKKLKSLHFSTQKPNIDLTKIIIL